MTQDSTLTAAIAPKAPARPALSNGRRWAVLGLLTLAVLISFIDRTNISAAIADKPFTDFFKMSPIDRGTLGSAFFWSYGVVQLFMGWMVDRYGVKWLYAVFFTVWCATTALTGMASSFAMLLGLRVLIGAAEAVVIPASYRWIRDNFDDSRAGTAIGIFTGGNKLGNAIGAPIAAWLVMHYGWQAMFVVTGLIGVVWLIPWLTVVPNDLPNREAMEETKRVANTVTWSNILRSPVVWGSLVINFSYGYFGFYCATWMPSYLVETRGLSLEESGVFTGLSFAGVALVAVFAGWLADQMIAKGRDPIKVRKAFIIGGFLGACTVLFSALTDKASVAVFWNIISLSILGFATANLQALCRLALIPKPAVGRVTGFQQVATSLSGGTAAALSGWLLQISGGYTLPMAMIFVFLVLGAATTWLMMRPEWSPKVNEA
ncbi:MFS transporter [Novosphingobium flavum]|uniref:MFS transporter n=1 Tax=Novosphingobium flavum TaxID=1778672 RepID=A0A7X1FS07_9SPHN|nr:MFS transporter [Novosphingobium flavum]MBC2665873.1 MFS transporter [Novosphingobium flavum]